MQQGTWEGSCGFSSAQFISFSLAELVVNGPKCSFESKA